MIFEKYTEEGWINVPAAIALAKEHNCQYLASIGGRGTGKTFGALKYSLIDSPSYFMFMRRSEKQIKIINNPLLSPVNDLNLELGTRFITKKIGDGMSGIYETDGEGEPLGLPLGVTSALSTFANMRGFSATEIKTLIYDEFIPQKQERPIRDEGEAFVQAYETINRNRELKGDSPLLALLYSNSNAIGNPIFVYLEIVSDLMDMFRKKRDVYINEKRRIVVIDYSDSPISKAKSDTSLYQLLGVNNAMYKMAIGNEFVDDDMSDVKSISLKGYKPVCQLGEIYFYYGARGEWYATRHASGAPEKFGTSEKEVKRFKKHYNSILYAYIQGNMFFEEYFFKLLFTKYISM